jgi:hypothetical protein
MRISAGSGTAQTQVPGTVPNSQVLAYGALLVELPEGSTATLVLKIAQMQGTPLILACPTHSTSWTAGDDQPAPGPSYDCAAQHYPGRVSADGTSVTFKLTASFESTPGQLSLAIVPDLSNPGLPAGSAPFAVDTNPPGESSFTPNEQTALKPEPEGYTPPAYAGPALSTYAGGPLGGPSVLPPPAVTQANPAPVPTRPKPPTAAPPAATIVATSQSLRSRVAQALGGAVLVAAVLVWSLGYGLLGGRITPLSVPLRA